ncbi:hypothetical protein IFO70_34235 [Phormidium tenue FACHB-886]|nr:hypothetical protein [Phormidium tenue FACHB-886]
MSFQKQALLLDYTHRNFVVSAHLMIQPGLPNLRHSAQIQQPLLKGKIWVAAEPMLQIVFAVRVPGGLTPP